MQYGGGKRKPSAATGQGRGGLSPGQSEQYGGARCANRSSPKVWGQKKVVATTQRAGGQL